jgi:hypothetical protein
MQIDRTRFLLLTTAIAAGNAACNPGEGAPPAVAVSNEAPDAGAAGPTTEGAGPTREGGGPAREGGLFGGPSREGTGPTREGGVGPSQEGTALVDAGSATAPPLAGCPDSDNMVGTPGSCSGLRAPGPQCESFTDTKQQCDRFAHGMKPRAAQRAVACLLAKSGSKAICDFEATQKCALEAIEASCIDPGTGPTCDAVVQNCGRGRGRPSITKAACMHALSALSGSNRARVATCMTESCGVQYCFYDLK